MGAPVPPPPPSVPPVPPAPPAPGRRGPGAVTVLSLVLALLLTIWCVGSILLIRYAPDLPNPEPSPTPTQTRSR